MSHKIISKNYHFITLSTPEPIDKNHHSRQSSATSFNTDEITRDKYPRSENRYSGKLSKNWIRSSLVKYMETSGDNVFYLFDIENGKILADHIAGKYEGLNSQEKNLAFLWSCFLTRDDLLEPFHRIGADLLSTLPNEGFTAIHLAAFSGSVACCQWLMFNGLALNSVVQKLSPLDCAVLGNAPDCAELLLRHGATLSNTVLHCAVEANATDCLQHLLNVNAKINAVDEKGLTALHVAADLGREKCLQIMILHCPKADLSIPTRWRKSTPLHLASENGHFECCQLLIDGGAEVEAVNQKEQTALHLAAQNQSAKCLEILLDAGCNVNALDENRSTPLHKALSDPNLNFSALEVLLKRGADVNLSDWIGYTALHLAAKVQSTECMERLLDAGCNVNAQAANGKTPLYLALSRPESAFNAVEVLLKRGAQVNVSDRHGDTPLHFAARDQSPDCLQLLLDAGCGVNTPNTNGLTPLHKVFSGTKLDSNVLKLLLQRGASVNVSDVHGCTPLHLAAKAASAECLEILLDAGCNVNVRTVSGRAPLHVALSKPNLAFSVVEILLKRGADVNLRDRRGNTPLHLVASHQSTDCLQILLDARCNVNAQDENGSTPLHKALTGPTLAFNALEVLLKRGADANVRDKNGYTPLHLAAEALSVESMEILLNAGSNINAQTVSGKTPLHIALSKPSLAFNAVEYLLQKGANVNVSDMHGNTPLHLVARDQSTDCLILLLDAGCDVNFQDENGSTPLHKALSGPKLAFNVLNVLLKRGALLNVRDKQGYTPLHLVAGTASTECLEILLDAGCDVNAQTVSGQTALHIALSRPNVTLKALEILLKKGADANIGDRHGCTPLHLVVNDQHIDGLNLLLGAGCDINAQDKDGLTPLHKTLTGAKLEVNALKVLLKRGACVNVSDKQGCTPLHLAADAGNTECLEVLLDAGGHVHAQTTGGKTPLHIALSRPKIALDAIGILLKQGANVNVSDRHGHTPLHLVARDQNTECLKILLDAGSNINAQDENGLTPLHKALTGPELALNALDVLLERGADVNVSDRLGYTPLHLAALNDISSDGISQCVDRLVMSGADVTARTHDGLSALSIISRNTPGSINAICRKLDSSISITDREAFKKEVQLELDFDYLLQSASAREMVFLKTLEREGYKHLIEHPLCKAFLHLKWQRIRMFYFCHLFLSLAFVMLLTVYVIFAVAHECYNAAKSISTGAQMCSSDFTLVNNSKKDSVSTEACKMCLNNPNIGLFLIERPHLIESIWYLLALMAVFKGAWKIVTIPGHVTMKHYFYRFINVFEWFVILSVFLVSCSYGHTFDWQKNIGGLAVLLAWTNFMIMIGQLPIFGIYVAMFTRVQTEFFKLLIAYSCLLVGITASFCVVFPTDETFQNPLIGLIKVLAMTTGDVDFEILDRNLDSKTSSLLSVSAYMAYALFLFFAAVVLMNLLVGISVHDIQGLYKTAGLSKLVRRMELIYFLELAICKSYLPKRLVELLLNLVSFQTSVLYVEPFHPREKKLPKEVMMDAFNLAKQKKTWISTACCWSDTLKHRADSSAQKGSYEELQQLKETVQIQNELISKSMKNNCINSLEDRFTKHEKHLYEELRQLKEMNRVQNELISKLMNNNCHSSSEDRFVELARNFYEELRQLKQAVGVKEDIALKTSE